MHENPVKRGLVLEPGQWAWSSFRDYAQNHPGRVKLNQWPAARLKRTDLTQPKAPPLLGLPGALNLPARAPASVGNRHGLLRRLFGLIPLFRRIDREQHEVIETMAAEIPPFAEFKIELRAVGQPELFILLCEHYGTVFDDLMLAGQLDRGSRADQVRFHANDLKGIGLDPRPPFQSDRVPFAIEHIRVKPVGTIGALPEINQPRRLAVPIPQAFAGHLKLVTHGRMKNHRQ